MLQNFQKALKLVLAHEGGWSDHPEDPGGATNFGVTQRVYDAFRRNRGNPRRKLTFTLIPTCADPHPWAHWRIPMDMIFHGRSMRLFHASQQRATMSS